MKTYEYTVYYTEEGFNHERQFGGDQAGAQKFYDGLPASEYKALWQTWRSPHYGEQLMSVHYPKGATK